MLRFLPMKPTVDDKPTAIIIIIIIIKKIIIIIKNKCKKTAVYTQVNGE